MLQVASGNFRDKLNQECVFELSDGELIATLPGPIKMGQDRLLKCLRSSAASIVATSRKLDTLGCFL